eukprot:560608-Rhodomonas_salina.7
MAVQYLILTSRMPPPVNQSGFPLFTTGIPRYLPPKCAVQICLRACYLKSGTDLADGSIPTSVALGACYAMSGTGFLDPEARWIWTEQTSNETAQSGIATTFSTTKQLAKAANISLHILLGDCVGLDYASVFVNDLYVGDVSGGSDLIGGSTIFSAVLYEGPNTIAVLALNTGGPAAFLLSAVADTGDVIIRSDAAWYYTTLCSTMRCPNALSSYVMCGTDTARRGTRTWSVRARALDNVWPCTACGRGYSGPPVVLRAC